jgi:hypothetical protein
MSRNDLTDFLRSSPAASQRAKQSPSHFRSEAVVNATPQSGFGLTIEPQSRNCQQLPQTEGVGAEVVLNKEMRL